MTETGHLTLEQFIVAMNRKPVALLTHDELMELGGRLNLSDELVHANARFCADHYARNLVCRTPAFELLVLCSNPGHESTIHDHAGALNAIRVFSGELTSRLFAPATAEPADAVGLVALASEERLWPGSLTGVDRDGIHQLANASQENLVTVHVYAPPLTELVVYSTSSPEIEQRPLRYTLAQDLT